MGEMDKIEDFSLGQEFFEHWQSMKRRDGGKIPYRHDFDPARIKSLLPHTFVGESRDENTFMIRLIGTWIEQFIGQAKPNDNIFNNYKTKEKEQYKNFIKNIFNHPCVGYLDRSIILHNRERFSFKSIYCPFNDNLGEPRFIIGVSHLKGVKDWHVDDFTKLLKKSVFNSFEYIDIGYGKPDDN
jgi:hypothetical protein